jgi:hypothetical protein
LEGPGFGGDAVWFCDDRGVGCAGGAAMGIEVSVVKGVVLRVGSWGKLRERVGLG